jgi:hypothetical protein
MRPIGRAALKPCFCKVVIKLPVQSMVTSSHAERRQHG